jgi:hypothetical protein
MLALRFPQAICSEQAFPHVHTQYSCKSIDTGETMDMTMQGVGVRATWSMKAQGGGGGGGTHPPKAYVFGGMGLR